MKKIVGIMLLFIVLFSGCANQLQETAISTEMISEIESMVEKENTVEPGTDDISSDEYEPLPTIEFKEQEPLQATELAYRTEHSLIGIDEGYYYFIEDDDRVREGGYDPALIERFYRVDQENGERQGTIGNDR